MADRQGETLEEKERRLMLEEERLEAERVRLDEEKANLERRGWRDNVYGRINVSVRTMDRVIVIIGLLLVAAIVAGIVCR